jgi:hypothetical protein
MMTSGWMMMSGWMDDDEMAMMCTDGLDVHIRAHCGGELLLVPRTPGLARKIYCC